MLTMILHLLLTLQVGHEFGGNLGHVQIVSECPELHSFNILSDNRFKAYSETIPPHGAIYSFLLQMRVSSPVLTVIQ